MSEIGIDLLATLISSSNEDEDPVPLVKTLLKHKGNPTQTKGFCGTTIIYGGPGQGKSTVGQIICQAHRVAWLDSEDELLDEKARATRGQLLERFEQLEIPLPLMKRWPVYIRLSEFGDYTLDHHRASLLDYIAEKVSEAVPQDVSASDLFEWLKETPWLVVLDGLDEVPDATVRYSLTQKLHAFRADVTHGQGDVLIVGTTRPQGYGGEFDDWNAMSYELSPFSVVTALNYAARLAESRHKGETDFIGELKSRMEAASKNGLTQRLMTTPLQVSILTSLLEDRGRPPQTRHALFSEYYSTIYRRETAKAGRKGELLEIHKFDIEKIHDRVGLELQLKAEAGGPAEPFLYVSDLEAIAVEHLSLQGYDDDAASLLAKELVGLATDRLVLLVELRAGEMGFEVRSIQEFIASRALIDGSDDQILEGLRIILPSAHWRNTWLFAMTALFDIRSHLRDSIAQMMRDADTDTVVSLAIKPGARAAADLLDDGLAATAPKYRRILLAQVMDLFDVPRLTNRVISIIATLGNDVPVLCGLIESRIGAFMRGSAINRENVQYALGIWGNHPGKLGAFARSRRAFRASLTPSRSGLDLGAAIGEAVDKQELDDLSLAKVRNFASSLRGVVLVVHEFDRTLQASHDSGLSFVAIDDLMTDDVAASFIIETMSCLPEDQRGIGEWIFESLADWVQRKPVGQLLPISKS